MKWFVFPEQGNVSLKYTRDRDGQLHYVLTLPPGPGAPPGELVRNNWQQVAGRPKCWTLPIPRDNTAKFPMDYFRRMGARYQNFDLTNTRDKDRFHSAFCLTGCPPEANEIGPNASGTMVREANGQRWIGGHNWYNHESLSYPADALRFSHRDEFSRLAAQLVNQARDKPLDLPVLANKLVERKRTGTSPAISPQTALEWLLEDAYACIIRNPASISPTRDWKDVVRLQPMLPDLPDQATGLPPILVMAFRMALAGTDDFPTTGISCLRPEGRTATLVDALIGQGTNPLQADRFFLDLRHQDSVEAGNFIMEHLNNRADNGVSLILLKGNPNDPQIAAMREELGRTFGIESSCHIKPGLAQTEDGESLVAIAVGERRPKPLPVATGVALRLMVAELPQDLHQWYLVDVRTGRQRIHELHTGKEPEILQQRQAPYRSMGRTGLVSSMIPRGHQVALNRAQQKFRDQYGDDVDGFVATRMGLDPEGIPERFSPEQVDAIAFNEWSADRDRGFLLGDQTGLGKGRTLCGIAGSWLNAHPENRVLYFTSRPGNMEDVVRDVIDINLPVFGQLGLVGSTPPPVDPAVAKPYPGGAGNEAERLYQTLDWPRDNRMLVTPYTSYQGEVNVGNRPNLPIQDWLLSVCDSERTLVIMDESHDAIALDSNRGQLLRKALRLAGRTVFASATFLKRDEGDDLYFSLLPASLRQREGNRFHDLDGAGGDRRMYNVLPANHEVVTTQFIEDGVYLRRDHDLSSVPRSMDWPIPEEEAGNLIIENDFRALGQAIIRLRSLISRHYPEMTNHHNPLSSMSNSIVNVCKVPQVIRIARDAIARGRKPQISINETGGAWMDRITRAEPGAGLPNRPFGFRDFIRNKVELITTVKFRNGTQLDLGLEGPPEIRALLDEIHDRIDQLPDLPPSPIDAIRLGLAREGISMGELTGRKYQFNHEGKLQHRNPDPTNDIIKAYNDGDLDVLLFNQVGSTGYSFHADPRFRDQRPRTIILMETSPNVATTVQSEGRGNRYNQTSTPEIISVTTGMKAELKGLMSYYKKLHSMGAIIDSERDHPGINPEIPDICNRVGDEATRRVLNDNPRLGEVVMGRWSDGISIGWQGLAGQMLNAIPFMDEDDQETLWANVLIQYDNLIEEHNQNGTNPLKTPSLPGYVTIDSSERYFTDEEEVGEEIEESAFLQPSSHHSGKWHRPFCLNIDQVREMVARNARTGRHPADMLERAKTLMAMQGGEGVDGTITHALSSYSPGDILQFQGSGDMAIMTEYLPPETDAQLNLPYHHRFKVLYAGDERPVSKPIDALDHGMWKEASLIGNILRDPDGRLGNQFETLALNRSKNYPIQIITGNPLAIERVVRENTGFSNKKVRFANGQSTIAAVCTSQQLIPYRHTPVGVKAQTAWQSWQFNAGSTNHDRAIQKIPGSDTRREQPFINLTHHHDVKLLSAILPSLSKENHRRFWDLDTGPDIANLLNLGDRNEHRGSVKHNFNLDGDRDRALAFMAMLEAHGGVHLTMEGGKRDFLTSDAFANLNQPLDLHVHPWAADVDDLMDVFAKARMAFQWYSSNLGRITLPFLALNTRSVSVAMQVTGNDSTLVRLPEFTSRAQGFWQSPEGRHIWSRTRNQDMPDKPASIQGARMFQRCLPDEEIPSIIDPLMAIAGHEECRMVIPSEFMPGEPKPEPMRLTM